jgi:hypothetical protein
MVVTDTLLRKISQLPAAERLAVREAILNDPSD